jgi:uncharacterized protein (UPF0332 family)
MNFDLDGLIKERIRKAADTLEAAKLLASENHWNSVINRLYYSAFYAVLALLAKMDARTSTHSGAKSEFYRLFIKTGRIDKKYGELYTDLFSKRQEGDYEDFLNFTQEEINPLLPRVEEFLEIITNEIDAIN